MHNVKIDEQQFIPHDDKYNNIIHIIPEPLPVHSGLLYLPYTANLGEFLNWYRVGLDSHKFEFLCSMISFIFFPNSPEDD